MADELFIDPPALKKIASRLYDGGSDCTFALDPSHQFLCDDMFGGRRKDIGQAFVSWFIQEDGKVNDLVNQTLSHADHVHSDATLFEQQNDEHKSVFQRQEV
jgi:hypothetical protein